MIGRALTINRKVAPTKRGGMFDDGAQEDQVRG
jgi:hypothetical protein